MKEEILQKLIDGAGEYFLAHRYIPGYGRSDDTWEALIIAPDIPRSLWGKKILEMPYKEVRDFAESEIKTIIHLGRTYQPFQYGIRNNSFIDLKEVTCPPMELVVKCYQDNIKDYYEITKVMDKIKH